MTNEQTAVAKFHGELDALQAMTPELIELLPLVPDADRAGHDYLRAGVVVA